MKRANIALFPYNRFVNRLFDFQGFHEILFQDGEILMYLPTQMDVLTPPNSPHGNIALGKYDRHM